MDKEFSIPANLKKDLAIYGPKAGVEETLPVAAPKPRLKVVTGSAGAELKQVYGVGSVVVMPDGVPILAGDERTPAVPLFRWLSWQQIRDRLDQTDFFIKEETTDIHHPVAAAARNASTRFCDYEDGQVDKKGNPLQWKFVENINFLFALPDHHLVAAYSWASGGHRFGANLNRYLERREVPIFCNRIDLFVGMARNKQGDDWEQLMWETAKSPFVEDKAARDGYFAMYEDLRDQFAETAAIHVATTG